MNLAENQSIIYESEFQMLFNDLDMYGHLNASRYLDYLTTSRFLFPRSAFGLDEKYFLEKDLGFYVKTCQLNFLRPIIGLRVFGVRSWMVETDGTNVLLNVKFFCPKKGTVYCDGRLIICAVSPKSGRPKPINEDAWQFLSKKEIKYLPLVDHVNPF